MASDNEYDRGRDDYDRDRDDRRRDEYDDRRRDEYDRRPGGGDPVAAAKSKVKPGGIGLIITAIISLGFAVFGLVFTLTMFDAQWDAEMEKGVAQQPAANQEQFRDLMTKMKPVIKAVGPVFNGLQIVCSLLILLGATKMLNLSSAGWGKAAAILAIVPVHHCVAWILGLIFGILALVALSKPVVKRGFALKKQGATGNPPDDDRWSDTGR